MIRRLLALIPLVVTCVGCTSAVTGAPNVDSRATGSTLGDFLHATDFAPIPDPGKYARPLAHARKSESAHA